MLANPFRLLLSGFAYRPLDGLRRIGPKGTDMAAAQSDTLRLKLIKVAARVRVTARRIVFRLASSCPFEPQLRPRFQLILRQQLTTRTNKPRLCAPSRKKGGGTWRGCHPPPPCPGVAFQDRDR
jgi:Transposase DDE domain group 1